MSDNFARFIGSPEWGRIKTRLDDTGMKYIFIYAEQKSVAQGNTQGSGMARTVLNLVTKSVVTPRIGIYWNKTDGTVVQHSFIPETGSNSYQFYTGKFDEYLHGYTPSSIHIEK